MDSDCIRRQAGLDRGPSGARCSGYSTAATCAAAGRRGLWLRVGKVLVLHPATLAVVGHVPESVGDGFGDRNSGPGTDHRHHRGAITGLGPNVQTSGGVLPIGDPQGQDRSDRLRCGTLGPRHCGGLDWWSRDPSAEFLLSRSRLTRGQLHRRRRGWSWVRNLCVITWNYCTGDAYAQGSYDYRWNCNSCCAHPDRRPQRPSWAWSRHVFSIPRNETKALSPAGV
jgi:hypothetical protein